jgi:polyhydroxybutyrate depolymerase
MTRLIPAEPAPPPAAPKHSPAPAVPAADLVGERPYELVIPAGIEPGKRVPLLVLLHGFGASGRAFRNMFDFERLAQSKSFIYTVPEGVENSRGSQLWNATPACCNFRNVDVDDVAYLSALIDDAVGKAPVDETRIFVVGHSNGGFMAHRLACERSDRIAGIVSVAGALFDDESRCRPSTPVAVLQIHGDQDWHVPYKGGRVLRRTKGAKHPSAVETIARWAAHNGCDKQPVDGGTRDLEPAIPGDETSVTRHQHCKHGAAELWTVKGGDHFVAGEEVAFAAIYEFLMAHPKPR